MKNPVILFVLLGLLLAISSCTDKKEHIITNPPVPFDMDNYAEVDWVIYFYGRAGTDGRGSHILQIYWNGATEFVEPDTIAFFIGGEQIPLSHPTIGTGYYTDAADNLQIDEGEVYQFTLMVNNETKFDRLVRTCYHHDTTYPETFDPHQTATITWSMTNHNSFQYVEAIASEGSPKEFVGEWGRFIAPSARGIVIPENVLQEVDGNFAFQLSVTQIMIATQGRTVFNNYWVNFHEYNPPGQKQGSLSFDPQSIMHKMMRMNLP